MHKEQMRVAYTSINRAIAILLVLDGKVVELEPDDTENLLHQIHCHLCDACTALEPQVASDKPAVIQQPGSELEEHIGLLKYLTGMLGGVIDNRLSAYNETRDPDRQLWNLMGFLNKNMSDEINKIKLDT